MMVKIDNIKTTTYDAGDGWRVDIVEMPGEYEAYLYREDYGVKSLMFGCPIDQNGEHWTVERFAELVQDGLDEYKAQYDNDYTD